MKNSLAACGQAFLTVLAPDGSLTQFTYLPTSVPPGPSPVVPFSTVLVGPAPFVYVVYPPQNGQTDTVVMRLSPNPLAVTVPLACVADSATYAIAPVAPGEIVTLYGNGLGPLKGVVTPATLQSPFPLLVNNVEVTFDDTPSPLLYVQDGQINAVAPWSLVPGQTTQVCVSYDGSATNCLTWPVAAVNPSVFTVDGFHAAALNQDGTVNSASNPAQSGSVVTVFAMGMGPLNPPQADGTLVGLPLPANVMPSSVVYYDETQTWNPICHCWQTSTTAALDVDYAGPAPFELAGLTQINVHVTVPSETPLWVQLQSGGSVVQSNYFSVYVTAQ